MCISCRKDTGGKVLERGEPSEAKEAQGKGRVDSGMQRKGKADSGVQKKVAVATVAKPTEGRKKMARKSQGQSTAKEQEGVVSQLLGYQTQQQNHLLFNYEAAGPWFDEVSQRMSPHTCIHTM